MSRRKLRSSAIFGVPFCFFAIASIFMGALTRPAASLPGIATNHRNTGCALRGPLRVGEFKALMQAVADGWNQGNAEAAASCFTEDAIYSGPPSGGHHGRKSLYEFFGGASGRRLPMKMEWHNLVFDAERQVGTGEYTFRYEIQTHGIVIVKLSRGLIRNWREYEVESNLPWDQFVGDNRF